jgi:hypothetical protein
MRGGVNTVVRVGDVVHRPGGEWTPAVHAVLAHVATAGFTGAPRPHGRTDDGAEIVDFIAGDVPDYPLPDYVRTDQALRDVAALLRAFHDATVDFVAPPGARWRLPARQPAEVICHSDVAPYNSVFRDGRLVAFIDFDTAHPGPRVWDVAYAAYRFVPLTGPDNPDGYGSTAEQARRLRLFCDAYGLGDADRTALLPTVERRLLAMVDHIRTQAAAGSAAFAEHLAQGHDTLYLADAAYVARRGRALAGV